MKSKLKSNLKKPKLTKTSNPKPKKIRKINKKKVQSIANTISKSPATIADLAKSTAKSMKRQFKNIFKNKGKFNTSIIQHSKNDVITKKSVTRRRLKYQKFDPDNNETKMKQVSARQSQITSFLS